MGAQADRIHNAIYAALDVEFPCVSWDKDTGLRTTSAVESEKPSTILIRELSAAFDGARNERRTPRLRERTEWVWGARIAFDNQVSLEAFEQTLSDTPLFLLRTAELDQQVVITLDEVEYTHPPEQASSSGSRASLTFTASLSRK